MQAEQDSRNKKEDVLNQEITSDTVRRLAEYAGITVPDEDVDSVVAALRAYRSAFSVVEKLDLTEIDPVVVTDPRWTR
jgi:Asp-tRNA(Asn)/Glu-tRNA(Gln) amidotransferase C subunit